MPDPAARLPKVTPDEWTEENRDVFTILSGNATFNPDNSRNHVLATFALHPRLTKPFLHFNRHLLAESSVPVRLRQIAILRTAWKRACRYMWSSHLRLSLQLGLTPEDFEAAQAGPGSPHWAPFEATVVRAVDQLCDGSDLDDATWQALSAELDHQQILDLLFTVGAYAALAMVFNATRVDREPELEALGDRYGAP
jgi:alkylhydroperoxidase family enzyme